MYKYEDTKNARRDRFQMGDFLYSYDLKSAYHHLDIVDIHRTFLGLGFDFDELTRYCVFNVLPFGIASAGYIFSKLLREVVKHLRSQGERVIMFLDDGLGGDSGFDKASKTSIRVKTQIKN